MRDIFREFEPSLEFSTEFRLLKERHALFDLEEVLVNSYAPENIDLAIKDFQWITSNFARKSGRFRKLGMSYDARTNNAFSVATAKFIDELVDYEFPMSWHFYDFKKTYISQISKRIATKIFVSDFRKKPGSETAYLAYPGKEGFKSAAKRYIASIIRGIQQQNQQSSDSVVGLHNAIPPFSVELINKGLSYFDECRVIITDRDPRDVFVNYPKDSYGRYLPFTGNMLEKARSFAHFYKSIRKEQNEVKAHPKVLFLRFEDVCLNYQEYKKIIFDFSEVEKSAHKLCGVKFNPERSISNIGMWKKSKGDLAKAVEFIEEELSEYLYRG